MEEFSKLLEGPKGKVISAALISFTAILLSFGIALLNYLGGNSSIISYILCSIPCIISFFYLGASFHLSIIESKADRLVAAELGELISKRMAHLSSLIEDGKFALRQFKNKSIWEVMLHNQETHINILMLRRLISALEERQNNLIEISANFSASNLKIAEELSFAPLAFANSSVHSINQTEMPILAQEQWEDSLNSMIRSLEFNKVAA